MKNLLTCLLVLVFAVLLSVTISCRGDGDKESGTAATDDSTDNASSMGTAEMAGNPVDEKNEFASDEAFEKKQKEWEKKLSGDFSFVTVKPFLVVGNMSKKIWKRGLTRLEYYAKHTIDDCMKAYYKGYLKKKPNYVLTVFLFKDGKTYRAWAKKLFNDDDVSYYGYYSSYDKSLVMNISTGGGTLVHEMFHALVDPEFPNIPSWVNEGIASLYEQCDVNDKGHLVGLMNWRFPNLKENLNTDKYVKLRDLMNTTTREFYNDTHGLHYAEARYFCKWLEGKGLLRKFYKKLLKDHKTDKKGIATIESIVGKKVEEFEKEWRAWCARQKYVR